MPDATFFLQIQFLQKSSAALDIEILRHCLVSFGIAQSQIVEESSGGNLCLKVYFYQVSKVRILEKQLNNLKLRNVSVKVGKIYRSDWQNKWKRDFKPFRLTKDFDVVPLWYKDRYKTNKRRALYLDTTLAFGTGLHETTRFMAEFINQYQKGGVFLDVGSGSGILAIMAAQLGSKKVDALDIDHDTIKTAKNNFQKNGLEKIRLKVCDIRDYHVKYFYDFVAANLTMDDLINIKHHLSALVKYDGYLAVSGVLLEQVRRLKRAFQPLPLNLVKIKKGRKWVALLYRKVK